MRGDEERIRDGGCDAYLSKPISVPKFIETIRRSLGSARVCQPLVAAAKQKGGGATKSYTSIRLRIWVRSSNLFGRANKYRASQGSQRAGDTFKKG
jgi:DNA-binding NarL/FixJ family response regulator